MAGSRNGKDIFIGSLSPVSLRESFDEWLGSVVLPDCTDYNQQRADDAECQVADQTGNQTQDSANDC